MRLLSCVNKRLLAIAIIASLTGGMLVNAAGASESVSVSINNVPTVDIALSTRYTDLVLDDFEKDLKQELENLGVDTRNMRFITTSTSSISSQGCDLNEIFRDWGRIGWPGDWRIDTYEGEQVIWNHQNTDGQTAFYCKDNFNIRNMEISFDCRTTDGDNDYIGVMTRFSVKSEDVADPGDKIATTYLWNMNLNCNSEFHPSAPSYWNGLFRIRDHRFNKYTSDGTDNWPKIPYGTENFKLLQEDTKGYPLNRQWFNVRMSVQGNRIQGWINGNKQIDYTDNDVKAINKGSFGFYNLSQPSMWRNFNLELELYKTLKEILDETIWRDSAYHVIVNVDETKDDSLSGKTEGEMLARTINDDIHLIQWGSDENKILFSNFIHKNDDNGEFLSGLEYGEYIDKTAIYIKNLIEQESSKEYVIVGSDVNLGVEPESLKNGAISDDFPDGRWSLKHDYKYFENDLGVSYANGIYMQDLNINFDKPGKYEITFDDDTVKEVYAHREPVAKFESTMKDGALNFDSNCSYDLDYSERASDEYGIGIENELWEYKYEDGNWTEIDKSDLSAKILSDKSKYILVKLTVTDYQGASNSVTQVFNTGYPISYFKFENNPESVGQKINPIELSYSSEGYDIIHWDWKITQGDRVYLTKTGREPDIIINDPGEYKVSLQVTDSKGNESEWYTKILYVQELKYGLKYAYNWNERHHDEFPDEKQVTWKKKVGKLETPSSHYLLSFNNTGDGDYYTDSNVYDPIKAPSTFQGWFYDALFYQEVKEEDIVESREPFNIYAKWQNNPIESPIYTDIKREYTIEYHEGDNGILATPSNATRTSDICKYDFLGWYDGDDLYSKGGDKPVLSENKTLDAHWKANSITLPNVTINSDASGKFLGWFTEPQNYENAAQAQYVGKQGDEIIVSIGPDGATWINGSTKGLYKYSPEDMYTPFNLYAWYNKTPVFINMYDGLFFEGQEVSYNDLLELIGTWDYETEYKNDKLEVVDEYFKDMLVIIDNEKDDIKEEIDYIIEEERENLGGSDDSYTEELEELRENLRNILKKREEIESARRKALKEVEARRLEPVISKIVYSADGEELSYYIEKTSSDGIQIAEKPEDMDYAKTYINTSTSKIGWLDITYQVHDDGIYYLDITEDEELEDDVTEEVEGETEEEKLVKIPNSDITVEYTRKCQINFNYNPLLNLQNMIYDKDFDFERKSLSDFVISRQAIRDSEDLENNTPWWSTKGDSEGLLLHKNNENTLKNMQDTIKITGINEILFSSVFENEDENKEAIEHFREEFISREGNLENDIQEDKSDLLNELYAFKNSDDDYYGVKKRDIWGAISGISITLDGRDQFGKYASNKLSSKFNYTIPDSSDVISVDVLNGAPIGYLNPEFNGGFKTNLEEGADYDIRIYQTEFERTIWLILLNPEYDSSLNYTRVKNGVRYIDLKYYKDILGKSYWGTTGYEKLEAALLKTDLTDEKLGELDNSEYTGSFGKSKVKVRDYSE